jgi:hypothetical protein
MPEVAVVHLVRAKNGIEPFKVFLDSYLRCPGGYDHDLIVLFKGFRSETDLLEYRALLKDVPHQSRCLMDFGFDIRGYFVAVRKYDYSYFCFLNSFSILLDVHWLAKLRNCMAETRAEMVGATGSWESNYTNNLLGQNTASTMVTRWKRAYGLKKLAHQFKPFPNYHIRTNGLLISYKVLSKVRKGFLLSKMDAHLFESGINGLTNQVSAMGFKFLIVGCDGLSYAPEEWHRSNTFRMGDQGNLLIADNQTRTYENATPEIKSLLSSFAWGSQANG